MTGPNAGDAAVPRRLRVGFDRLPGWLDRYDARHPGTVWSRTDDSVDAESPDGAGARVTVPFARIAVAQDPRSDLVAYVRHPWLVGVVVVRRGGFAIAYAKGADVLDRKVGRRHVQGRSKAGGWSQQRFARRRDNQAREAFAAAADHAARILGTDVAHHLDVLAVGGDRAAVQEVLADARLAQLTRIPRLVVGGVGDPRGETVQRVLDDARSVDISLVDPTTPPPPDA